MKIIYLFLNIIYHKKDKNIKPLSDQTLKTHNCLLRLFIRVELEIKTKLALFYFMVVPILIQEIDKLHVEFCKSILDVRQTPNVAFFGEVDMFPLSIICKGRTIKCWLKIMKSQDSPMYKIYVDQLGIL